MLNCSNPFSSNDSKPKISNIAIKSCCCCCCSDVRRILPLVVAVGVGAAAVLLLLVLRLGRGWILPLPAGDGLVFAADRPTGVTVVLAGAVLLPAVLLRVPTGLFAVGGVVVVVVVECLFNWWLILRTNLEMIHNSIHYTLEIIH